jgi:hypothetical protein
VTHHLVSPAGRAAIVAALTFSLIPSVHAQGQGDDSTRARPLSASVNRLVPAAPIASPEPAVRPRDVVVPARGFTLAQVAAPQPGRATFRPRARGTSAKLLGGLIGGLGGFFAGGYLGAKLEPDCRCDDPGLKGFIIGAPVGAIAGAFAGVALSSR